MRWRYCVFVVGPSALDPDVGAKATAQTNSALPSVACRRLQLCCVAAGLVLQRRCSISSGSTTVRDHGGAPVSQTHSHASFGPPWSKRSAWHHTWAVPTDVTHASRRAGMVAHKAPPRRISITSANVPNMQGIAWGQQCLPQAESKAGHGKTNGPFFFAVVPREMNLEKGGRLHFIRIISNST